MLGPDSLIDYVQKTFKKELKSNILNKKHFKVSIDKEQSFYVKFKSPTCFIVPDISDEEWENFRNNFLIKGGLNAYLKRNVDTLPLLGKDYLKLKHVINLWNLLNNEFIVYFPTELYSEVCYIKRKTIAPFSKVLEVKWFKIKSVSKEEWKSNEKRHTVFYPHYSLFLYNRIDFPDSFGREPVISSYDFYDYMGYGIGRTGGGNRIIFPVNENNFRISILMKIEKSYSFIGLDSIVSLFDPELPYGSFDYVFSDLYKLAKGFEDSNFDFLEKILNSEAFNVSEDFELFGVKIPLNLILNIGFPSLFFIQLYFLLYLQALRGMGNKTKIKNKGVWIGIFDNCGAIIFTYISVFIFPILTTIFSWYFWKYVLKYKITTFNIVSFICIIFVSSYGIFVYYTLLKKHIKKKGKN